MCSVFLQMLIAMRSRAMRVHSSLTLTITTLADSTTCVRECYQNSFRAITSASTPTPTPTPSPDLRICPSRPHDGFVPRYVALLSLFAAPFCLSSSPLHHLLLPPTLSSFPPPSSCLPFHALSFPHHFVFCTLVLLSFIGVTI